MYLIHYTSRQNTNFKKNSFGQINDTKSAFFFFRELQLIATVCVIFHSRFCFVFIKVYIFVQKNAWTL